MGPNLEARASIRHPFSSLTKAKVQAVIDFNTAKGSLRSKQEVFDYFMVGRTRGYAMLNDETNRHRHNTGLLDPCGRSSKLPETNVDRMDKILQTSGLETHVFTWSQLETTAEVQEVGWRTIQRAMDKKGYNNCIACTKTYTSEPLTAKRRDWAWKTKNT